MVKPIRRFAKDLKITKKRGYDISLPTDIVRLLSDGIAFPAKNLDHPLRGSFRVAGSAISLQIGFSSTR